MPRVFLCDFGTTGNVDDVFVVTNKQFSVTKTGKNFIKAIVSDRSAQIPARMWDANRSLFEALPDNGFARLRGRLESYQGSPQLIIESIGLAMAGTFDVSDLIPHTKKDIPTMCRKLAEMLGSIQNRHLAALMQAYLDDDKLMADFCRAPAAMSYHHAFLGGLLEHTLNAIEVADAVCKFYPGLSRDLVIAGIFLHDIAKTWELSYKSSFSYTDAGQLIGHIVKSAMWVEHKAKEAEAILGEKIPQQLIDVMQHIILSHHGELEFGAAKVPATPEAIAVHMIENMDAKLMTALSLCRGEGLGGEGNWTEFNKSFGGKLYRPDVSLQEAEEEQSIETKPAPSVQPPPSAPVAPPSPRSPAAVAPQPAAPAAPRVQAPTEVKITNPLFDAGPKKK